MLFDLVFTFLGIWLVTIALGVRSNQRMQRQIDVLNKQVSYLQYKIDPTEEQQFGDVLVEAFKSTTDKQGRPTIPQMRIINR